LGLQVSPEFLKELSEASSPKVLENITESESEDDDDELITYIK